jgi:hypothetical protein
VREFKAQRQNTDLDTKLFLSKAKAACAQGAAEKIKRENDVYLRQLAKKSTYVPSFFLILF